MFERHIVNPLIRFVHGGGWVERKVLHKPKTGFFTFLSVVWSAVTLPSSMPFWFEFPSSFTSTEWICTALMVPHPIFIIFAIVFWLKEPSKTMIGQVPNPDYDPQKLY